MQLDNGLESFKGSLDKSRCYDIQFNTGYGYEVNDVLYKVRDNKEPRDFDELMCCRLVDNAEYRYFRFIFKLCGLIQSNSTYIDRDWYLTARGLKVAPIAIIYDKIDNRVCASVDLFDIFRCDGHISWEVKCYKKAFKEVKKIAKLYKVLWPSIKMKLRVDLEGLFLKISKNSSYINGNKYIVRNFTNRVLRLWIEVDLNKLTDLQYGTVELLGKVMNLDSVNNTLDSQSTLWVKE